MAYNIEKIGSLNLGEGDGNEYILFSDSESINIKELNLWVKDNMYYYIGYSFCSSHSSVFEEYSDNRVIVTLYHRLEKVS